MEHWYLLFSDDDPIGTSYTSIDMSREQMIEMFVGKMIRNGGDEEYDLSHCIGIVLESELEHL